MIDDEKDRLGKLLHEVEKGREDQFFAERDRELIQKLRQKRSEAGQAMVKTETRGHCPQCGDSLQRQDHDGVGIDECPNCGGIWLGVAELERLATREGGPLARLLAARRR